jgi:hypothetical protein
LRRHPCRRFGWPCRKPQASRTPSPDGFVFIRPDKDEGPSANGEPTRGQKPKAKAVFKEKQRRATVNLNTAHCQRPAVNYNRPTAGRAGRPCQLLSFNGQATLTHTPYPYHGK